MIPYSERTHVEVTHFGENHCTTMMPYRGNENHVGFMYDGSQFVLAESTGLPLSMSIWGNDVTTSYIPVVGKFTIKYLKPCKKDLYNEVSMDKLEADEVMKNYGKLAIFSHQNQVAEKQLEYEMKLPPTTYDQYKKLNQVKIVEPMI